MPFIMLLPAIDVISPHTLLMRQADDTYFLLPGFVLGDVPSIRMPLPL